MKLGNLKILLHYFQEQNSNGRVKRYKTERHKNIFSKGFFHRECVAVSEEEENPLIGFGWKSSSLHAQKRE